MEAALENLCDNLPQEQGDQFEQMSDIKPSLISQEARKNFLPDDLELGESKKQDVGHERQILSEQLELPTPQLSTTDDEKLEQTACGLEQTACSLEDEDGYMIMKPDECQPVVDEREGQIQLLHTSLNERNHQVICLQEDIIRKQETICELQKQVDYLQNQERKLRSSDPNIIAEQLAAALAKVTELEKVIFLKDATIQDLVRVGVSAGNAGEHAQCSNQAGSKKKNDVLFTNAFGNCYVGTDALELLVGKPPSRKN